MINLCLYTQENIKYVQKDIIMQFSVQIYLV